VGWGSSSGRPKLIPGRDAFTIGGVHFRGKLGVLWLLSGADHPDLARALHQTGQGDARDPQDMDAAAMMGINVNRVSFTFALAGGWPEPEASSTFALHLDAPTWPSSG
jgi:hypothetical protein